VRILNFPNVGLRQLKAFCSLLLIVLFLFIFIFRCGSPAAEDLLLSFTCFLYFILFLFSGVGLRQLKAFCSPTWVPVPAHTEEKATWVEDPSAGAGGPALNRVGSDSVQPVYRMPDVAFTGQAKSMDGMIGLTSDYSLMSYSIPKNGVSEIPAATHSQKLSIST